MTYYDCIRDVDRIEPNAYEIEDKIRWIREIEGRVWTELFLMQPIGFHVDNMMNIYRQELSIPAPYNKIYRHYLRAMIHYGNAEPDRYNMDIGLFNQSWHELVRWFGQDYDSSDFHRNPVVETDLDFSALIQDSAEPLLSKGQTRTVESYNLRFSILDIPERCAFVGGQIIVEMRDLLGIEFEVEIRTKYKRLWKGTISDGKVVFLPMVIAPQGGDAIYAIMSEEPITPAIGSQDSYLWPVAHISGRMMVPESEHLGWRKAHIQPTWDLVAGEDK